MDIVTNLCLILRYQGRTTELRKLQRDNNLAFEDAIDEMCIEDVRKELGKAKSLIDRKKHIQAEAVLAPLVKAAPSQPDAWFLLGLALHRQTDDQSPEAEPLFRQRVVGAEVAYRKALALDKTQKNAWMFLGLMLATLGLRYTEAEKCFNEVLKLEPGHPNARRYIQMCKESASK